MTRKKLIISGLPAELHTDFHKIVDDVQACIEPTLQRSIDASVVGRFAVLELVNTYKGSAEVLARKLGFEVRSYD